jgi:hypothetical protein
MTERHLPTDAPDPQPGDFDAEPARLDLSDVTQRPGDRAARLSLQITLDGDDACALRRIAHARGQCPSEVIANLLRTA